MTGITLRQCCSLVVFCVSGEWLFFFFCFFLSFFFLQAEDGIRDLVRSRGLGDVYKRQAEGRAPAGFPVLVADRQAVRLLVVAAQVHRGGVGRPEPDADLTGAVSYTHMTLPTSDLG